MGKQVPALRWFCAVLFLLLFSINGAIASDAISKGSVIKIRSESKEMTLMKLLQKLETANPWTVKRVSEALDNKLIRDPKFSSSYVSARIDYDEDFTVDEVQLWLSEKDNKMENLILFISTDAKCFTLDNIKKMYPDIHSSQLPRGSYPLYDISRHWGNIVFEFETAGGGRYGTPGCLMGIIFIPKGME